MKFLSHVSTEVTPPSTYKLWRHAGAIEYLPLWLCVIAPPIFFAALDYQYYKVLKLVAVAVGIFVGFVLLPDRRTDKLARPVVYMSSVAAMTAPSIFFAVLDHSYSKILASTVLAVAIFGLGLWPIKGSAKPPFAIENDVLTIRTRLYIPAKTEVISLGRLRRVMIAGPRGDRDWIFESKDGLKTEIRPHFGDSMDDAAASLLKNAAGGRFAVVVQESYEPEP